MASGPNKKRAYEQSEFTPENIQDLLRCREDPVYFMKKFIKVTHPTKGMVPLELYHYQERMVDALLNHKDVIMLCSRQLGKCLQGQTHISTIVKPTGFKKVILKIVNRDLYERVSRNGDFKEIPKEKCKNIFTNLKHRLESWCLSAIDHTVGELYASSNSRAVSIPDITNNEKFIGEGLINRLVKTPKGYSPIKRVLRTIEYDVWELVLADGKKLQCADHHLVVASNGKDVRVEDLTIKDYVKTDSGISKVMSVSKLNLPAESMFDLELDDLDHVFYTSGILSHNTTIAAMYLLWMTNFHDKKEVIIASKNMSHAVQIMARIKAAYDELPHWLKAGAKYDSRTMLEFDNGSKITSEATSENTGRGSSPAAIMLDELAFASRRIQDGMWSSLAPALSTGGQFIVTSTPNGDSDLYAQLWRGAKSGQNNFFPVEAYWYEHPDRDEVYYKDMLGKLGPVKARQELDCLSGSTLINSSIGTISMENLYADLIKRQSEVRDFYD